MYGVPSVSEPALLIRSRSEDPAVNLRWSRALVCQIEQAMDTICTFAVELRTALEQVISCSASGEKTEKHDRHKKGHVTDVLGKSLRNVSPRCES